MNGLFQPVEMYKLVVPCYEIPTHALLVFAINDVLENFDTLDMCIFEKQRN